MGAKQWGNPGDMISTGTATFTYAHVGVPPPADMSAPADPSGNADTCTSNGYIAFLNVTRAYNASVTEYSFFLEGLALNYPFFVYILATMPNGAQIRLSATEIHVYARVFPPYRWDLAAFYDGSQLPTGTSVGRWEDSSGNGHYLEQAVGTQRPDAVRDILYSGPTSVLRFTRSRSTNLYGGSDNIDYGLTGDLTAYSIIRQYSFAPQMLFGRGSMDYYGTRHGWSVGISSGLYGSLAYIGIAGFDGASPKDINTGGGAMRPSTQYTTVTLGYQFTFGRANPAAPLYKSAVVYDKVVGTWRNYTLLCSYLFNRNVSGTMWIDTGSTLYWSLVGMPPPPTQTPDGITFLQPPKCDSNIIVKNITSPVPYELDFAQRQFRAFYDGEVTTPRLDTANFVHIGATKDTLDNPVGVTWGRGATGQDDTMSGRDTSYYWRDALGFPGPTSVNFRVGAQERRPGEGVWGDRDRAFDGEMMAVVLYRTKHSDAERQAVVAKLRENFYYTCDSILHSTNGAYSGACGGGVRGSQCGLACPTNWALHTGYTSLVCRGGTYGSAAVCAAQCNAFVGPRQYQTCNKTILYDNFNNAEAMLRYILYPSTPDILRRKIFTYDPVNRWVSADTYDPCTKLSPVTFAVPHYYWNYIIPWGQPIRSSARFAILTNGSVIGLQIRISSSVSPLSVMATLPSGDLTVYNGALGSPIIGKVSGVLQQMGIGLGDFFTVEATNVVTRLGNELQIRVNNQWIRNYTLTVASTWGSAGVYVSGQVRFTNITISSSCDGGNECRLLGGQDCSYTCRKGYTLARNTLTANGSVVASNGLVTCPTSGGNVISSFICLASPPNMTAQTYAIDEHLDKGKPVGIVQAIPAAEDMQIDFRIEQTLGCNTRPGITPLNGAGLGCNSTHYNATFLINSCSGVLTVNKPELLDYRYVQYFIITVRAMPDGEIMGSVTANHTIYIRDVDDSPEFLEREFYVNVTENFVGSLGFPALMSRFTYDNDQFPPVNQRLTYSLSTEFDGNMFSINSTTGQMGVRQGLDFESRMEGIPYMATVVASEEVDDTRSARASVFVTVLNANDPPRLQCDALCYLNVPETALNVSNVFVGALRATDDDARTPSAPPDWYTITYTITDNAYLPPTPAVNPLFRINNATGDVFTTRPMAFPLTASVPFMSRNVRAVFSINVTSCDKAQPPMCDTKSVAIAIEPNATIPDAPIIRQMELVTQSSGRLATRGMELIRFKGENFQTIAGFISMVFFGYLPKASGELVWNQFTSTNCTVFPGGFLIQCSTPAGMGANLDVNVTGKGQTVFSTVPLTVSYNSPMLMSLTPTVLTSTGFAPTDMVGRRIVLTGTNFGSDPTYVKGFYTNDNGLSTYNFQISACSHTQMTILVTDGCGAGHALSFTVAGQESTSSSLTVNVRFSYPVPRITLLASGSADYTLNTLPTSNSPRVRMTGANFGPLLFPNSSNVAPRAQFSGGIGGYYNDFMALCSKDAAAPHTAMNCFLPPGVSANFSWTVDVCGQRSAASVQKTSFAPPVITEISGVGARDANTDGGQVFVLRGSNFGDATLNLLPGAMIAGGAVPANAAIRSVRYGDIPTLEYDPTVNCTIDRPEIIICRTTEGSGRNYSVSINIGGQTATLGRHNSIFSISYAAPVISSFEGPGARDANTQGNMEVRINGYNFGNNIAKVSAKYIDAVQIPSDFTGVLPGIDGQLTYPLSPTSCRLDSQNPHRVMYCTLVPGGGSAISWRVTVSGQESTAPTTSYAVPEITGVALENGRQYASSEGGEVVVLTGRNFGLQSLIQQVRYGPTGSEYHCTNFTYIGHTVLKAVLVPGIGSGLVFTVMVADQLSQPSLGSISYAPPEIVSIVPNTFLTSEFGAIATIVGRNFGLLDPNVEVMVAFGNTPDNTFVARTQVLRSDQSLFGLTNGLQALQFSIPESIGVNRTVRLVVYRRSSGAPPDNSVAAYAPQGPNAFVSFKSPSIGQVTANVARAPELPIIESLFPELTGSLGSTLVIRLTIDARGRQESFGPDGSVTGGGVLRAVDWRALETDTFSTNVVRIANWTHNVITAYTLQRRGHVRVRIESKSQLLTASVAQRYVQTSESRTYDDSAPGLVGMLITYPGGYPTRGGQILQFKADGLATTSTLNVTVGGRPCVLVISETDLTPIPFDMVRSTLICPQTMAAYSGFNTCNEITPDPTFAWTITCRVPAGQGAEQPVRVIRDGDVASAARPGMSIDYRAPLIQTVEIWNRTMGRWDSSPYNPLVQYRIPTYGGRMRLVGTNFGICTSVKFQLKDLAYYQAHGQEEIDFCTEGVAPDGFSVVSVKANASAPCDHEYAEFDLPAGEGTGLASYLQGWYLQLITEGQAAGVPPTPVLLQYMQPAVDTILPAAGPTRGGTRLQVSGDYFGSMTTPQAWIGYDDPSGGRPYWSECLNVVRASQTSLQCTLPEYKVGRAFDLQVRVLVSDLAGQGGNFHYFRPSIQNISLITLNSTGAEILSRLVYTNITVGYENVTQIIGGQPVTLQRPIFEEVSNLSYYLGVAPHDIVVTKTYPEAATALVGSPTSPVRRRSEELVPLHGEPKGGYLVLLTGSDLGSGGSEGIYDPLFACAFAAWTGCLDLAATTPCDLRCDQMASDVGEGEIRGADVLYWSHEQVLFRMPPGAGYRFFTVRIGGQGPEEPRTVADFVYNTPELLVLRGLGDLRTEGGDRLVVSGLELPLPPLRPPADQLSSVSDRKNGLVYPFPLDGWPVNHFEPTSYLRINFDGRCVVSTKEPAALEATVSVAGSSACVANGEIVYAIEPAFHQRALRELSAVVANTSSHALTGDHSLRSSVQLPVEFLSYSKHLGQYMDMARAAGVNVTMGPNGIPLVRIDSISFPILPGVGRNKNVSFSLIDQGKEVWRSNSLNFSYDGPTIDMTMPNPIFIRDIVLSDMKLRVFGRNFGRMRDQSLWTEAERVLDMDVSGVKCAEPPRRQADEEAEWVECTLPREITVGAKNISLSIAGQVGFQSDELYRSVLVVCGNGWFGFSGEQCMPCPSGAACAGFLNANTANSSNMVRGRHDGIEVVRQGINTYPVPDPGFFNLNGSMADACPEGEQKDMLGRDVCIVACLPQEACIGNNYCADAYRSTAPFFRCGSCNKGYYRVSGDCMKCPNSPIALIIGMILLAMVAAGAAYVMQRMNLNLAFMSIGIDYMQVLAIFANSKVNWPPQLKELFRILSAFNLNIEIAAPECLVPDVSFKTKWGIIMALPVAVFLIFFLLHNISWCWIRVVKRQRIKKDRSHALKSASVLLMYFLYLYLTRTILDIFNCVPSPKVPPERDGRGKIITYLQAAQTEPCGIKGGTQMTLMPFAIIGMLVYVFGYPAFLAHMFWRKREVIMEDQLLRAMDTGNDRLTNPNAYGIRRAFGRTYYQFRPDLHFWVLFIIARKFLISVVALIFRLNPQFQLAMILMVIFVAYSLQVKWNPYMSPDDHAKTIEDHLRKAAEGDPLHSRLHSALESIRLRQGKKAAGYRFRLFYGGRFRPAALFGWVGQWLFDYNVVESILLFSAVLVCLMGIMFSALKVGAQYADMYAGLTWAVIVIVAVTLIYFVTVVVIEIWQQCQARKRARIELQKKKTGNIWERVTPGGDRPAAKQKGAIGASSSFLVGASRPGIDSAGLPESNINPMHVMSANDGEDDENSTFDLKAIINCTTPPSAAMWEILRKRIMLLIEQLEALQRQRREDNREMARTSAVGALAKKNGIRANAAKKDYGPSLINGVNDDFAYSGADVTPSAGGGNGQVDWDPDAPNPALRPKPRQKIFAETPMQIPGAVANDNPLHAKDARTSLSAMKATSVSARL
jgi:hypothetical protein